ncbi:WD40/YVTN/BNR-like repeat-containing protein [Heyndrickxia sp. NPDC080065]|uniref:WD40/YVTN/BNR-like repeat-containing protein n=1 Tax=Heyndrickxia sp. NPDC080065 TaxID=3390568 RepID=UPI003CFCB7E0
MKNFIIGAASLMMICLIIAIIFYQIATNTTYPQLAKTNDVQEKHIQNEPAQQQTLYAEHPIDYSLQNDQLNITFDKGKNWIEVPIGKDQLFDGDYNGSKQELIENSYILTKNRVSFLHTDGGRWDHQKIILTTSLDQGKTWNDSIISKRYLGIRFRKVSFLNDHFGYVIISGGRTMSQEGSNVYLTHDGGKTWRETNNSNVTRLIADGGFVDENTGFLSFGTINPDKPELHVTQDAGHTWSEAKINIPAKYNKIFVIAETPMKEGDHLAMLINQGPNGDYKGGKVKGMFLSKDKGETWKFVTEVEPNETEQR